MVNITQFLLQQIINFSFNYLDEDWQNFDLISFSKEKKLYLHQQEAVKNALKVLWKYYQKICDFEENESISNNYRRKKEFFDCYINNGLDQNIDINIEGLENNFKKVLIEILPKFERKIPYESFINRMSFWMATGSGKTLVIIKIIEILKFLIDYKEIPNYDILFLTYREDLIDQFKEQVENFNQTNKVKLILKDLKELPELKKNKILLNENEIIVYYYSSNNLDYIQKEKRIDFRNYFLEGKCYVFLDEAHKGDREESKRQQIYSLISRNGFLFNFSATFTDNRDIITCAYEFNLSSYITAGFGKHLKLLNEEILAFRKKDDYSEEEKVKIILKSLIILTYIKKKHLKIQDIKKRYYHEPLYLVIGKTVNTDNADLKAVFKVLKSLATTKLDLEFFNSCIQELLEDFQENPYFFFENDKVLEIKSEEMKTITQKDILELIFNSKDYGEIEIIRQLTNKQEIAFKLVKSERPFALLKIGDTSNWLKTVLRTFFIQERFEEETFFENLNANVSDINIMMGAQAFYEGWDSNRPNVINFINIGTSKEAKKFILQSIGRGIRIEPIMGKRQRLMNLYNAGIIPNEDLSVEDFNKIKGEVPTLESLFIYGTNKEAVNSIISELSSIKKSDIFTKLTYFEKNPICESIQLLIPKFSLSTNAILNVKKLPKYDINREDFEKIKAYLEYISDDRIILLGYNTDPKKVEKIRDFIKNPDNFRFIERTSKNVYNKIQNIFDYFNIIPIDSVEIKELKDEINHYYEISTNAENIKELEDKISIAKDPSIKQKELEDLFKKGLREEYDFKSKEFNESKEFETKHEKIRILYNDHHYYNPFIVAKSDNVDFIKHIIKIKSEIKFIEDLEKELAKKDNIFKQFDWWFFSKIEENTDEIHIPYYSDNKLRKFYPDFIFWFKKGKDYLILFIDPKGTEHIDWIDKINGFKMNFELKTKAKIFTYNVYNIRIKLLFRTEKIKSSIADYSKYWFDDLSALKSIFEYSTD